MVKIFSMTERLTKRENGKTAGLVVQKRKGTRLQTIEENGGISQIEILNRGD
jgi:hypothetical protein